MDVKIAKVATTSAGPHQNVPRNPLSSIRNRHVGKMSRKIGTPGEISMVKLHTITAPSPSSSTARGNGQELLACVERALPAVFT
jgi:hypothetical protein